MSDYISRDAAIEVLVNYYNSMKDFVGYNTHKKNAIEECIERIKNDILTANVVEKKIGEWIDDGTELGCCCDMCNITLDVFFDGDLSDVRMRKMPNFCPNCGAKMEGKT